MPKKAPPSTNSWDKFTDHVDKNAHCASDPETMRRNAAELAARGKEQDAATDKLAQDAARLQAGAARFERTAVKPTSKPSSIKNIAILGTIGFLLGAALGATLVATGVFAPLGVGILGITALALISGSISGAVLTLAGYFKSKKPSTSISESPKVGKSSSATSVPSHLTALGGKVKNAPTEEPAPTGHHNSPLQRGNATKRGAVPIHTPPVIENHHSDGCRPF